MEKNRTHVTFLLDRSGSMRSVWDDVEGGYTELIKAQKKEIGECTFTLITFDNEYSVEVDNQPIGEVSEELSVGPRGMTALRDAIGKSVTELGGQLSNMKENDRPEKVLFVIQTDGLENSSKEWNQEGIEKLIKQQEDKYNWQFLFLGANTDAMSNASNLGFSAGSSAQYSSAGGMTQMINKKFSQVRSMDATAYASEGVQFDNSDREELTK